MVFNAEINVCYRTGLYRNAPREIIGALPVVFYDRVLCLVISLMKVCLLLSFCLISCRSICTIMVNKTEL